MLGATIRLRMKRLAPVFFGVAALFVGCAAGPRRPRVDESAMREAMESSNAAEAYVSSGSYAHYLRSRVAHFAGDHRRAVDELRLALATDDGNPFLTTALAEEYARLTELDIAQRELRNLLERHPNYQPAHLLMGRILFEAQRFPPAAVYLKRAIQLKPKEPDAYLVLAQLQLELEAPDEAVRTMEAFGAAVPGEPLGYKRLGLALVEKADFVRAEKLLLRAAERDREDVETWVALAQIYEGTERPQKAAEAYDKALELDPDHREVLLAAGRLGLSSGSPARARAYFDRLLALSEDPEFAVKVAFSYLATRQLPAAAEVLDSARNAGLHEPRVSFYAGLVHEKLYRYLQAADAYAEVPRGNELFNEARLHRANCLSLAGQRGRALDLLKRALHENPNSLSVYSAYARVLERSGSFREAEHFLAKALKERPASELFEALAATYEREGKHAEAISLLSTALAKSPRDEVLLYTLGAAYERKGEFDKSIAQMRLVLQVNPDNAAAMNFIGYSLAEKGRDLEEAERLVRRALELRPDSGAFLDSLGWLYYRRGEYQRAVDTLERASALDPGEPLISEHLGDAYRRIAKKMQATEAYRRALEALLAAPELQEVKGQKQGLERKLKTLSTETADR